MSDILSLVVPSAAAIGARSDRSRSAAGGNADAFTSALDAPADKQKGEATDRQHRPDGRADEDGGSDHRTRLPFSDRMAKTLAALEARRKQSDADAIRLPDATAEDLPTVEAIGPTSAAVTKELDTEPTAASDVDPTEETTSNDQLQADAPDQPVIPPMPVVSRQEKTVPSQPQPAAAPGRRDEVTGTSRFAVDEPQATRTAETAFAPLPRGFEMAAAAGQPVARGAMPVHEDDPRASTRREPGQSATSTVATSQAQVSRQPAPAAQVETLRLGMQTRVDGPTLPVDEASPEAASVKTKAGTSTLADDAAPAPRVQVLSSSGTVAPAAVATMLPGPAQQLTSAMLTTLGTAQTQAANAAAPLPEATAARPAALHSLTIQLQPAELGRVLARMTINDGQLTVAVQVETSEAHQRISTDRDILSNALRSAGYEVDRIIVQQIQPGQAAQNQTLQGDQNRNAGNGFQAAGDGANGRGDGGANQGGGDGRQAALSPSSERAGQGDGGSLYI